MKFRYALFLIAILFLGKGLHAQTTYPSHGLHQNPSPVHAFTNVNLVTAPGEYIENGVLVIRNGLVENAGKKVRIPKDAAVHDMQGAWIYPGLIDPYTHLGLDKVQSARSRSPRYKGKRNGPYAWNDAVRPEERVTENLEYKEESAKKWRALGFTTVQIVPNDGIFRGQAAILNLGEGELADNILSANSAQAMSFSKGSSAQAYPSSLMGSIALIRQTFIDAGWYAQVEESRRKRPNTPLTETNISLDALNPNGNQRPFLFECSDYQDIFRAAKIAREFDRSFVYKTKGDEYKRIAEIRNLDAQFIVPLKFPENYDLSNPADAREVSLESLMHWEQAPLNPARLAALEIPFALTTQGLKSPKGEFWKAIHKAVQHGLSAEDALAALTTTPAAILGLEERMGTLEPGKIANFFVTPVALFESPKVKIAETWVNGRPFVQNELPLADLRGSWNAAFDGKSYTLLISGTLFEPKIKAISGTDTLKAQMMLDGLEISFVIPESKSPKAEKARLIGLVKGNSYASGPGVLPDGREVRWSATRTGDLPEAYAQEEKEKKEKKEDLNAPDLTSIPGPVYPFAAYGRSSLPQEETVLIRNATIWTNTDSGILQKGDVLIQNGKIAAVGQGLNVPGNGLEIDGTGMHITPGIIDEHSHIAISRGVNEGSHAVTAEVRIGDVVDGTDVNIYRQLSGGVTTSQLLHGSANPIGGQSAIIKLRWGLLPEEMKFEEAPGFIKFALGENVKQSNWGDNYRSRYPQTRMGVEQLIRDAFQAATDYRRAMEAGEKGTGSGLPERRNLQMETLLEIMDRERFVTCHSYVQSEITMLMRVAESFGFNINTFTHVLEGYKIADKIAAHGASGSTFSDWWAYKYEVIDAVPYNAAILNRMGVNTCLNSDDAEMGRRLNQEAAKAVKYGGVSEEEALKMVTLNPAKALHIDEYVGSIEVGKDADLVLWNDHPLSIYTRANITWIDGRRYFDRSRDLQLRNQIAAERNRIASKIMTQSKGKGKAPARKEKQLYHCDTELSDYNHE